MPQSKKIIVVGAGLVGLSCAYELSKSGHEVHVLDRNPEGDTSGCSYGNAGLIVPSHFIPLAAPGVMSQGLKWLLDNKSPFYIKPRLSLSLMKWIWHFYQAATPEKVKAAAPILLQLNQLSRQLYVELANELDFGLETKGLLMMYKSDHGEEEEKSMGEKAIEMGMKVSFLDAPQVKELNPDIKLDVKGAVHFHDDGHLLPTQLNEKLITHLKTKGVSFHYGKDVQGFIKDRNEVVGVRLHVGSMLADRVVIAAGAWAPQLERELGLKIPIQAGKGYSLTVTTPNQKMTLPALLTEARMAVTPMADRMRFAGTMEVTGLKAGISENRIEGIKNSIPQFFPEFDMSQLTAIKPWSGLRPCSPDGLPYIGNVSRFRSVIMASGHAMMGVSLAPVTGLLVKELIDGENSSVDLKLMKPERY